MSICAEIIGSICNDDGTVDLLLGPIGDDGPGQNHLKVLNPPADLETFCKAVAFQKIWGGSSEIMIRETKWADRVGYERIRLVEPSSEPSIGQMRIDLKNAGWTERNLTTYIDPNGAWYRGPFGAWQEMKRRLSAAI